MGGMNLIRRILRTLTLAPIALILVFEDWGWEPLARAAAKLSRLPLWAYLERKIAGLSRWPALAVYAIPFLSLLPVKLLALALFARGDALAGLVLLVVAKLLGTAILARLFQLTQPALMQFDWFARWYPRWVSWKSNLVFAVHRSRLWRMARTAKTSIKSWFGR